MLRLTNSRQSNTCPVISLKDMHACTYTPPHASSFALIPLNINNLPCDNHMYWINYQVIYPSQTVFKMTCKHRRYILIAFINVKCIIRFFHSFRHKRKVQETNEIYRVRVKGKSPCKIYHKYRLTCYNQTASSKR